MNGPRYLYLFLLCVGAAGFGATLFPATALAQVYVADGVLLADEVDGVYGEAFSVPEALLDDLRAVAQGAVVEVAGLPTAPGERRTVVLERRNLWAPEARLLQVVKGEVTELAKGERHYFLGSDPTDPRFRVGLALDPTSGELRGVSRGPGNFYDIYRQGGSYQIVASRTSARAQGLEQSCGGAELKNLSPAGPDHPFGEPLLDVPPIAARSLAKGVNDPTYQAVIALDTDNEFHHKKFGNDVDEATVWIEDLFVAMNVFYERDLDMGLLIGETVFRLDTDPSPTYDDDPWNVGGPGASGAQLTEFGTFWFATQGGVDRVLAALLSGKSASGFSASGIAWVDGYCENQSTGGGYSINQIFTSAAVSVSNDARLVGHELGHNFGSPHTHCYSPPVDTCYALESGCYSGNVSCPAEGTGTLMSYCHFSTGASCGTNRSEFHPTVIALLEGFRDAHYPGCITDYIGPGEIFADGFESANIFNWDVTVP